jgi:hypothetical protein
MNAEKQLEHWLRTDLPLSPLISLQAAQRALGWSPETLTQALRVLSETVPFYADHHQWVNPWAPVGPEELVTYLCPTWLSLWGMGFILAWVFVSTTHMPYDCRQPSPAFVATGFNSAVVF